MSEIQDAFGRPGLEPTSTSRADSDDGLLTGQVRDTDDAPARAWFRRRPSGSAMPLVRARKADVTPLQSMYAGGAISGSRVGASVRFSPFWTGAGRRDSRDTALRAVAQ